MHCHKAIKECAESYVQYGWDEMPESMQAALREDALSGKFAPANYGLPSEFDYSYFTEDFDLDLNTPESDEAVDAFTEAFENALYEAARA